PWLGCDVSGRRGIEFQFLAQIGDKYSQVFWLFRAVASPDSRKDHSMRKHLAAIGHEVLDEIVLLGREMNRFAVDFYAALLRIDAEVTHCVNRVPLRRSRTAQQSAHARCEFGHSKWLGNVVVGAKVKSFYFSGFIFLD